MINIIHVVQTMPQATHLEMVDTTYKHGDDWEVTLFEPHYKYRGEDQNN